MHAQSTWLGKVCVRVRDKKSLFWVKGPEQTAGQKENMREMKQDGPVGDTRCHPSLGSYEL